MQGKTNHFINRRMLPTPYADFHHDLEEKALKLYNRIYNEGEQAEWTDYPLGVGFLLISPIIFSLGLVLVSEKAVNFTATLLQKPTEMFLRSDPNAISDSNNHFMYLPKELQITIFNQLRLDDVIMLALVSKDYNRTVLHIALPTFFNKINNSINSQGFTEQESDSLLSQIGEKILSLKLNPTDLDITNRSISYCPNLHSLSLRIYTENISWWAANFPFFPEKLLELQHLTQLHLTNCNLGINEIQKLADHLPSLTHLSLAGSKIGPEEGLIITKWLTQLEHLKLRAPYRNEMNMEFAATLANLTNLKTFIFSDLPEDCRIFYQEKKDYALEMVKSLKACKNLTTLTLTNAAVDHEVGTFLSVLFPHLTELGLSHNPHIGDNAALAIASSLTHLVSLNLNRNGLSNATAESIVKEFIKRDELDYLGLWGSGDVSPDLQKEIEAKFPLAQIDFS